MFMLVPLTHLSNRILCIVFSPVFSSFVSGFLQRRGLGGGFASDTPSALVGSLERTPHGVPAFCPGLATLGRDRAPTLGSPFLSYW